MKFHSFVIFLFLIVSLLCSCEQKSQNGPFQELNKNSTGIDFRNMLREDENFNIFKYQYFNNGGGVAAGDFNNDGLQDLVFTGNMVKNRLYINKGDLTFEDKTAQAGIAEKEGWCTGVTTVDINQDGWLDIYICRAGYPFKKLRSNLLFINNGDLTFTEKATQYGLDDIAFSTQSAFFDYDKDGDLDCFILNHSTVEYSRGSLEVIQLRKKKDPNFTNKLFRNDGGTFTNVTEQAGILSNVLTFSLGITISDINNDNWPDIFIGNDFNEPDYLFINQQDGTFTESFEDAFDHTSMFSMGSDIADINNDGRLDLISLDMLPESNFLQKMHAGADNYDKIDMLEKNGFYNQSSRNMLQLNNGDGTFSEIGQLAGVSNTDWSWAALIFDFDNDSKNDIFIGNGYPRDHTDMDFLNFTANEVIKIQDGENHVEFEEYMGQMPPILLPNYFYQNSGNLQFKNQTNDWGLDDPMISQSATYADLDNDGDLDLIVNNTQDFARVFKNTSAENSAHHHLSVSFEGHAGNPFGVGAKVRLYAGDQVFYKEQQLVRGFQSTMSPVLHFGLGEINQVDSVTIIWPTDEQQTLKNIATDQRITVKISNAEKRIQQKKPALQTYFTADNSIAFEHKESRFNDFNIQPLMPWFFSSEGPALATADVNNDGMEDVYAGNARDASAQLFIQQSGGRFTEQNSTLFQENARRENTDAVFFDANNDGLLDLYVGNGSYEFQGADPALADELYINTGNGNFRLAAENLGDININTTAVATADADADGDIDIFIGGGYKYGEYPKTSPSYLLQNDGTGQFKKTILLSESTFQVGDALWADLDDDKTPELVVAGEWTTIKVYEWGNGSLAEKTSQYFDAPQHGLWNSLHATDLDNDGDLDLVAGNLGLNTQLSASENEPLELYYGDYDQNGSIDPLLCYYVQGQSWPFASRDDLLGQLPGLKRNFLFFKDYAEAQIDGILTAEQLSASKKLKVTTLRSIWLENQNGRFVAHQLPIESQVAPIHAINSMDVNADGHTDLILAGNTLQARVKIGRMDSNHGIILLGNGAGDFSISDASTAAIHCKGAVRNIQILDKEKAPALLFGINNAPLQMYQLN